MPSDYQKICIDNIRRRGEEFDDIGRLISEQLYSDRSHFVYELLQNTEDALARRFTLNPDDSSPRKVQFRLFHDRLEFRHFGAPFNEEDVKGISDVLKGTKKEDLIQIGKFGIGFKSVYGFTASPEIHSGEEHFIIKRYIRPEAKDLIFSIADSETFFNFPFDHEELSEKDAFDLILTKLRGLGPRVLLFLRWIREIEWSVEPDGEKGQYLKEPVKVKNCENACCVTVIGQNNGKDENENWLIFERPVPVPDVSYQVPVEVGFRVEISNKDKIEGITRIKDAPLVVYFPTEKATRFGFLIQGPYRTTPSRDNIPKGDDWNTTLVRETAHLLIDVLHSLKELGLLSVSLLETLPIRMDDFPKDSIFYPIVVAVRNALMNQDLLPADDGTFVSAGNAKLASAEWLRTVLEHENLRQLFKTKTDLKWISGNITEGTKHDLWKYMREELKVEEVTPDSLARKVDSSFFENQTDEWFIEFYKQLVGQKALWKKSIILGWDSAGPLRAKPFIRLQDGSRQVRPFRDDGSPNVYLPAGTNYDTSLPIVKVGLTKDEDARCFLKELGIPELDLVAEVIEHILPKYLSPVPLDEHQHDIDKIVQAYKTDFPEKKQRLRERLLKTPFILTVTPGSAKANYRIPNETYFKTDDLNSYFSGNKDVGFVSSNYGQPALELFEKLGVSNEIRVECRSKPGSLEHVNLGNKNGYRRGLKGFDPEIKVAGLEHALTTVSIEKSVIVWNQIAVHYAHCIKGRILRSSRQDFSPNASTYKEEDFVSDFGHLLIDLAWLPGPTGGFLKPTELRIDDLPELFIRDEKLPEQLAMKKDVVAKLAERAGIPVEDIELLRQYPEEFQQWKVHITGGRQKPEFPTRTVTNLERRQERLIEQLAGAPGKKYVDRERSVRTTRSAVDSSLWLRQQYTNDAGQMVCQICKEKMPFKKRDGEYYFEAVEALSRDHFTVEHEAQFLALCPLCAARYKEFVKGDEDVMNDLKHALKNSEKPEVPLNLGELKTSIRFVQSHWRDMKTILQEKG